MTDDFEQRMRDMLQDRSAHAPDDQPVVHQVLHDVHEPAPRRRGPSPWRSWLVPVVAAGAVAAVAATVVGVQNFRPSAHSATVVGGSGTPAPSDLATARLRPTPTSTLPAPRLSASAPAPTGLAGFRASDLTWVGSAGWAIGSAPCTRTAGHCLRIAHTTDGATWSAVVAPPADPPDAQGGCGDSCVDHVRFATADIGYAYGARTFFATVDGGRTWTAEAGGAVALETLDGNVIRVQSECFPGCVVTVQTSPIGSSEWTSRSLPGAQPRMTSGVTLVRVGNHAYLESYGHPAGGAGQATSVLFVSADDGASWANRGEPCPQTGGGPAGDEVDSTAIAAGGGALLIQCTPRGLSTGFVEWSTDGGTSYRRSSRSDYPSGGPTAVSGQVVLVSGPGGLLNSTDAGDTAHTVLVPGGAYPLANLRWLGFESRTDARALSADGSTVWTSHDTGTSWLPTTFG